MFSPNYLDQEEAYTTLSKTVKSVLVGWLLSHT